MQNGSTDRDAVWNLNSDRPKEACIRWDAHWCQLANTSELSMCSGDVACCKITLSTCFFNHRCFLFLMIAFVVLEIQTSGQSNLITSHIAAAYGIRQMSPVCTLPNTCILGPTRVHNLNGISIGSAVFARLTVMNDRPRYIDNNRPHLRT